MTFVKDNPKEKNPLLKKGIKVFVQGLKGFSDPGNQWYFISVK